MNRAIATLTFVLYMLILGQTKTNIVAIFAITLLIRKGVAHG